LLVKYIVSEMAINKVSAILYSARSFSDKIDRARFNVPPNTL